MLRARVNRQHNDMAGKQAGVSLVELMVAMVISLIVSGAMVMLMANTLGTGSRTIAMTRLTQEMRTALQIMTRDLRRANYLSPLDMRQCFANVDCISDLAASNANFSNIGAIEIGDDSDGDGFGECLSFWLDRDLDGDPEPSEVGAFRLTSASGIGRIEVLTNFTSMGGNNCPSGTWLGITDPDIIDVQSFVVDDTDTYTETITESGSTQTVQKIRLSMTADLINDGSSSFTISREIGDQIRIRNNYTTP